MADVMDKFWSAPPMSRTLVASMLVLSGLVHGGVLSGYRVLFYTPAMYKLPVPELWRLVTPFLLTGSGFNMIWDLYFAWTYSSGLELKSPRFSEPGSYLTYLIFCAITIIVAGGLGLGSYIFTQALLIAIIYTFAQDNRGRKAHFILFQIPVELLPWATLGLTLIMGGPGAALQQGTGVVAAHLYDFLTRLYPTFQGGKNYIKTPAMVRSWFSSPQGTYRNTGFGQSFRPATHQGSVPIDRQAGSSWTSGFSTGSWGSRGSGHRLGGD